MAGLDLNPRVADLLIHSLGGAVRVALLPDSMASGAAGFRCCVFGTCFGFIDLLIASRGIRVGVRLLADLVNAKFAEARKTSLTP